MSKNKIDREAERRARADRKRLGKAASRHGEPIIHVPPRSLDKRRRSR